MRNSLFLNLRAVSDPIVCKGAEASSTWVSGGRLLQMNWSVSLYRPVHIQPGYGCNWPHHHLLRCLVHFSMNLSVLIFAF